MHVDPWRRNNIFWTCLISVHIEFHIELNLFCWWEKILCFMIIVISSVIGNLVIYELMEHSTIQACGRCASLIQKQCYIFCSDKYNQKINSMKIKVLCSRLWNALDRRFEQTRFCNLIGTLLVLVPHTLYLLHWFGCQF